MDHADIWRGIDALAARHSLTVSGLARLAGLDATVFNKSKRQAADGRPRWPSTESLSRVLAAVGASLDDFASLVQVCGRGSAPLVGLAQAGPDGFFDAAGFPDNRGWEDVCFPGKLIEDGLYALEISGDSMLPAYRPGDQIIVSPEKAIHPGDRVVACTRDGETMAKILERRTAGLIELKSLNALHAPRFFEPDSLAWMARIMWVSQ